MSMVLGRLPLYGELEASPDCSQAPLCRGNRGCLPRTNEAPLPTLRRIGWLHGLGYAARSVPLLRGSVAGSPSFPRDGAATSILAALRRRQHKASPAFD